MKRRPRIKNDDYLDFIRSLPCCICHNDIETEACHIRFADESVGKRYVGKGEKPDDAWAVPMCGKHHRQQHVGDELEFWIYHNIGPLMLSLALWRAYTLDDRELAEHIIRSRRGRL